MPNRKLVMIGSSTGGPKILEAIFAELPPLDAAVVIVQHITPVIDEAFAGSLGQLSRMPVLLIRDGMAVETGKVYIAPGGIHMTLERNHTFRLIQGEKVNSVKPSIDVAMKSLQAPLTSRLVGVILTGMGHDGAAGISHIKRLGGATIAQDRSTSVIFGMPRAAAETGNVDFILPTPRIGAKIYELLK